MWRVRSGVLTAVMVVLAVGLSTSPAPAAAPWGACGRGAEESKVVTQYPLNARTYATLRCGGPRWDSNPTWGYRHILAGHLEDFERLAIGTRQNWHDVVDLAMDAIAHDPDAVRPAGGGKACYSRAIQLRNLRTNQLVRTQIVRMYLVISSGDIITVYPHSAQCP